MREREREGERERQREREREKEREKERERERKREREREREREINTLCFFDRLICPVQWVLETFQPAAVSITVVPSKYHCTLPWNT